ncbi:hypothetical protein B0J11DRAFT_569765 [Dendryphion nanum]|uniref:Transmembrane protein n=1 Tax=Dendryphion nanum TaxID=256645 RepID=A0A9P9IGD4_9PLEO|nr:hypothetical protein B0J11DRAFT_569765 [Dendryphion nanum]
MPFPRPLLRAPSVLHPEVDVMPVRLEKRSSWKTWNIVILNIANLLVAATTLGIILAHDTFSCGKSIESPLAATTVTTYASITRTQNLPNSRILSFIRMTTETSEDETTTIIADDEPTSTNSAKRLNYLNLSSKKLGLSGATTSSRGGSSSAISVTGNIMKRDISIINSGNTLLTKITIKPDGITPAKPSGGTTTEVFVTKTVTARTTVYITKVHAPDTSRTSSAMPLSTSFFTLDSLPTSGATRSFALPFPFFFWVTQSRRHVLHRIHPEPRHESADCVDFINPTLPFQSSVSSPSSQNHVQLPYSSPIAIPSLITYSGSRRPSTLFATNIFKATSTPYFGPADGTRTSSVFRTTTLPVGYVPGSIVPVATQWNELAVAVSHQISHEAMCFQKIEVIAVDAQGANVCDVM